MNKGASKGSKWRRKLLSIFGRITLFRKRLLLIWAIISTFVNLVWGYIELQPIVTLSYVAENANPIRSPIPIRITNSGLFEIEVFRIGGLVRTPVTKDQTCASGVQGPFFTEKLIIPPNSSYDFNLVYKEIPGWKKWSPLLIQVEYKIPALLKATGVQSVFVPQYTKDMDIGWISGVLRDLQLCNLNDQSEIPFQGRE